jgi:hypothetical protein
MAQLNEQTLQILKDKYGYTKKEIESLRGLKAKKFYFVEPRIEKDKLPESSNE